MNFLMLLYMLGNQRLISIKLDRKTLDYSFQVLTRL